MSKTSFMDAVVLFGDSLTEAPTDGSLHQRMAEYFVRRMDVVNRGFSGYNSDWATPVLKQIMATKEDQQAGRAQKIRLMTLWLGANDSVLKGEPQHVPLDRFKTNLSRLIDMIHSPSSDYYSPETKIIVINPPPIIVHKWAARLAQIRIETKEYSMACLDVARSHDLPFVDMYTALVQAAGGADDGSLDPYLYDGLHLTSPGYEVLQKELVRVIEANYPDLMADNVPMRFPNWRDIDITKPSKSLGE